MRVLLIKMSSLGDVVHALAGVTDAAHALPGVVFDWVVEEAYQTIPAWHPAVRRTILAPLRRWRKTPVKSVWSGELKNFREQLRRDSYDLVLDAQGLLKSAFVGQQARGPLAGRSARSAREPAAALLYNRRIEIDLARTEVEQLRQLFAQALGYATPTTPADFGIDPAHFPKTADAPYAVFLHGAAWKSKLWPVENWIQLGRHARQRGLRVLLPWGNQEEKDRAAKIAREIDGEVLDQMELPALARLLASASFVLGLDTGLTHIAIALGTRTLTLYGPSVPVYDRIARGELINLCSSDSKTVDTSRLNTVPAQAVTNSIAIWLENR